MSLYKDVNPLVYESIQESLDIAKKCIETKKDGSSDGCYGMPALILLCSAIDSMGSFYPSKNVFSWLNNTFKGSGKGTHFSEFYDAFYDIIHTEISKDDFCKGSYSIAVAYRNRSIHNNGLWENTIITTEGTTLLEKDEQNGKRTLNIVKLLDLTEQCFAKLQKEHLLPQKEEEQEKRQIKQTPKSTGLTGCGF